VVATDLHALRPVCLDVVRSGPRSRMIYQVHQSLSRRYQIRIPVGSYLA
jgi:hypothetical protein